ncbi:DNA-binding domain-containing protein [Escherichia coli]|uniref:conjugal transfer nickase/helicase domain-containing protein n=3 Tax=Escherichia coli TaxID=562 RepID=UPI000DD4ACF6|nr:TraI domain-containing protein [Escherichia coli]EFA6784884.1 DNA-binding domain-containing protein [Escherichia coli]MBC9611263.1 TraI domain-containing protein [Escherichia coli]
MFKLRKFFTSGSAVEIPDDGRSVPGTPEGFYAPLTTDSLLMPKNRAQCLKQIRDNNMMPKPLCEAMCCAPVYSLLLSTQNVPAAREGRWSHAGGFGDLTLLHTSYAVRLARAHMFPPGASAEEQAAQGAAWHAVIFWSALFYHLPLLAHLEGKLFSGRGWQPGISVPDEAYRFRFRQLPPQGTEAQQLAAVIAGGLLPEGAAAWLATVPGALQNLAGAFWHQHPEMALIRDVLQEAARQAESPLLNGGIVATASHIASAEVFTGEVVVSGKTESTVASAVSGEEAAAEGNTVSGNAAESVQEQPEMRQQQAEKPTTPDSSEGSEDDAGCETESIPTDEDTAMLVSMFAEEARAPEKGEDDSPSGEVVAPVSSTGEISAAGHGEICQSYQDAEQQEYCEAESDAVNPDLTGERFLEWLKDGLKNGSLSFNNKGDKIHVVAGFVFIPVPGIFYDYLKARQLPGEKREVLQTAFERLNIHKRKDNQRFYHARIAEALGKTHGYKILKGYLIKGRGLMDTGDLNDSPNFFFSERRRSVFW